MIMQKSEIVYGYAIVNGEIVWLYKKVKYREGIGMEKDAGVYIYI